MAPVDLVQPAPSPLGEELGVTLSLPFGSWSEEVMNPAEEELPDLLERLDAMQRNDGHARALYRLLTLPIRQASWSIKPAEGGEREAEFIEAMFSRPPHQGGMTTSFDYIRALFGKATVNGFVVFEEVYDLADMSEFGGPSQAIVLRKLAHREAKTIRFRVDDHGGFDGVKQRAYDRTGYKDVVIPKEKVLFFTVDKEEHPFYGRSMFLPCLFHSDKKRKLYYIAHIAAQFNAVPGRLGYLDTDDLTKATKASFRAALADFGFNTAMMVPKGARVEPFGGGGSIGSELLALINHHNIQAAQSVLAQFIDLSVGTTTGTRSLSEDFSGIFLLCLEAILRSIQEHINWYLIPKFIDWNFGTRRYPELVFDPLSDEMRDAMIDVFKGITTAGQNRTSPEFLHELEKRISEKFGLPLEYDAIDGTIAVPEPEPGVRGVEEPEPEIPAGAANPLAALSESTLNDALVQLAEKRQTLLRQFSRLNEVGVGAGDPQRGAQALSEVVRDIQSRLVALSYDVGEDGTNGVYRAPTKSAVARFQTDNGLDASGTVDLATYSLLLQESPLGS